MRIRRKKEGRKTWNKMARSGQGLMGSARACAKRTWKDKRCSMGKVSVRGRFHVIFSTVQPVTENGSVNDMFAGAILLLYCLDLYIFIPNYGL